jgi:hypothetical protein
MWIVLILLVILTAVAYLMMPSAKVQDQKAAGINDLQGPTAEIGRSIPVLFGERDLNGPNSCWYGDFRAVPIKSSGGKK